MPSVNQLRIPVHTLVQPLPLQHHSPSRSLFVLRVAAPAFLAWVSFDNCEVINAARLSLIDHEDITCLSPG
jgi:hypothetical protein